MLRTSLSRESVGLKKSKARKLRDQNMALFQESRNAAFSQRLKPNPTSQGKSPVMLSQREGEVTSAEMESIGHRTQDIGRIAARLHLNGVHEAQSQRSETYLNKQRAAQCSELLPGGAETEMGPCKSPSTEVDQWLSRTGEARDARSQADLNRTMQLPPSVKHFTARTNRASMKPIINPSNYHEQNNFGFADHCLSQSTPVD